MTTFTATLPSTKSAVGARIEFTRTGPHSGILTIYQRRGGRCGYRVTEFPADGGRGYRFQKFTANDGCDDAGEGVYDVFFPASGDASYESCDCMGFTQHGHCKHVEAAHIIGYRGWMKAEPQLFAEPVEAVALRSLAVETAHFEATQAVKPAAAKPARPLCRSCGVRPNDGFGVLCEQCEGRF